MAKKKIEKKESEKIADGLYVLNSQNKDMLKPSIIKQVVYTMLGNQDKVINGLPILKGKDAEKQDIAFAFKQTKNNKETFFIKTDEAGILINPISPSAVNNTFQNKLLKDDKLRLYKKVSEECFGHYLEFLKTKNVLHYKFACRETNT